jgi:hypothetical protein
MIPVALVFIISLARGSQPEPGQELPWVASADVSSTAGPFNVRFVPRYPNLSAAPGLRDQDIAAFTADIATLDDARRAAALRSLQQRLDAVRHWESHFSAAVSDPRVAPNRRLEANDQRQVLMLEAATLELQLGMLGQEVEVDTDSLDDDRVSIGQDLVIGADEQVRSAVVIGADLVVEGEILEDAVAVLGNIVVVPGAHVDGDAVVVGGRLQVEPGARVVRRQTVAATVSEQRHEVSSWRTLSTRLVSFLTFSGIGALAVGLFPAHVGRIAAFAEHRPVGSFLFGMFGLPAVLLTSVLLTLTILGIPVALVVLGALGAGAVLGLVGVCQAAGDRLPLAIPHGRWLVFTAMAAAMANLGTLPLLLQLSVVVACTVGLGAALASRLGRAPG